MTITWLGMSCFKIQTKNATLIIDPYSDKCGLKMAKNKVDIALVTNVNNDCANNTPRLIGDNFLIDGPGEYEKNQVFIQGLTAGAKEQAQDTIYYIEAEEISLGHLGALNHALSNAQLETMEGVDILFLPLTSLDAEKRSKIISQIEPRVIIPMEYKIPKTKPKLETVDKFLKEMGVKEKKAEDKYKVVKKELPADETKVIVLNPNI